MSINIPSHYVSEFATNVQLLLQQKGSKLRSHVMVGSHKGKQASPVDQVGAVEAQKKTTRFGAMGRVDAAVDRRWVLPTDYELPQLIDTQDKLRLITDPQSLYVQNAVFALGRAQDAEIVTALFGTAKTGETGSTSTTFPAGNIVAVNFESAANVGLTVAKLIEAKRLLMAAEVDLDTDDITCVISAKQHGNLLKEAQIVSTDFNDKPVLVEGRIVRFLGINFVHSEKLTYSTHRLVPVFAKSGMHLGIWEDIKTSVSVRNDLSGEPVQVYAAGTFGATRIEENKTIQVLCAE